MSNSHKHTGMLYVRPSKYITVTCCRQLLLTTHSDQLYTILKYFLFHTVLRKVLLQLQDKIFSHYWYDTHTTVLLLFWNMSGTTRMSRYQRGKTRKVKTNLDLLEQEMVCGNGICWAICKSAPHPRQPRQHPTTQFFTGRMPFLPPNQQRQSTEGISLLV